MADAIAGWLEPGQPTKYLDAETTGRTVGGIEVVRERVRDPELISALGTTVDADSLDTVIGRLKKSVSHLSSIESLLNSEDFATQAKQDTQITLLTSIRDNTDTFEVTLSDVDLNTDEIEAQLLSIFTELGEKLETSDITVLSTESTLSTLLGRFPSLSALADTTINPTLTKISTFPHVYNGSDWDRLRGDITFGIDVDITRSVLPSGASTSAKQDVQQTTLDTLGTEATLQGIRRAQTDQRVLFDYDTRLDANPVYVGKAVQGTDTNTSSWQVQRFSYDAQGRATDIQVLIGAWDDRATLGWI